MTIIAANTRFRWHCHVVPVLNGKQTKNLREQNSVQTWQQR